MNDEQLGDAVRRAREGRDITVRGLAADIDMDWSALSRSEHGKRAFKAVELVAISRTLGIPLDELVGASTEMRVAARTAHQAGQDLSDAVARWVGAADTAVRLFFATNPKAVQTPVPWIQASTGTKLPELRRVAVSSATVRDLLTSTLAELPERFVLESAPTKHDD